MPLPMQSVWVIWGIGSHVCHEAGEHIPPLATGWGVPWWGRGVWPLTFVKYDVRGGAGAVHDVVYVHEDPLGPHLDGEVLRVGGPGDPQVQVKGRCMVCLRGGALGVPFGFCIVQALLSRRSGHPWGHPLHGPTDGNGSC